MTFPTSDGLTVSVPEIPLLGIPQTELLSIENGRFTSCHLWGSCALQAPWCSFKVLRNSISR